MQLVTNFSPVITENDQNSSMNVRYCPKTPTNGKKVQKKPPKNRNFCYTRPRQKIQWGPFASAASLASRLDNISALSLVECQGVLAFHAVTQPYPLHQPVIQFNIHVSLWGEKAKK